MKKNELILSVRDLNIKFNLRGKILHAIRGIDLDVYHGEVLAIVGESGSGKSVFTKSFMGLLDSNGSITSGTIDYFGADDHQPIRLSELKKEKDWLKVRGHEIAMIMQDPMTSLNPLKTIGDQIMEAVELHQGLKGAAAREKTLEYLRDVGIADPEVRFKQYPHEFSGGMRQRVVIAIAVACNPQILICDEPTTALDVTIQAQILELLKEMRVKYNLTIILITHDLGVVANIADRVAVMYAGDIVEIGTSDEIYYDPRHPYTWALLSSMPQMGVKGEDLFNIQGTPPNLFTEIHGDAFAPRNPLALKIARDGLELLGKRDFSGLAALLGVSVGEAKAAASKVLALNPIPSCSFAGSEQIAYVAPDAEFSVQQGQLVIELNERILPRLSVNAEYAALMNTSDDPEVQRYVKEKLSEAQALIKGVHTRCDTLVQMLTLIGREQHGFFCGGEAPLPVTMQQLSEKMGVSTSTVSRAAQNKYIQFQGRIIPVRSFFTTAIRPDAAVSSHAVKQRLQSLIRAEDPAAPLSDEALRLALSALGIEVSRRAVAKYRAEMGIPSSSQRKKR